MGLYLRYWRPGKVLECFGHRLPAGAGGHLRGARGGAIGGAGSAVSRSSAMALAVAIIVYGFLASALPVWLLLAPRGYLSTFVKLGVIMMLAVGILSRAAGAADCRRSRASWTARGPIFAGKIFPFCFITIACGAISGFHSLIASGTTPKMIAKESHARPVGYGSMLLESFVALMAMIAACALQPGVYFAVNSPAGVVGATPAAAVATIIVVGLPGERGGHGRAGARRGRDSRFSSHRRRALAGAGDGAHLRAQRRRAGRDRASGTTSPSCSRRCLF